MTDLEVAFDNWLHGQDVPAEVYEGSLATVAFDGAYLRNLLFEAFEAGYDQFSSEMPRMPW